MQGNNTGPVQHPNFLSQRLLAEIKNEVSYFKDKSVWMSSRFKDDWNHQDVQDGVYYIAIPSDDIKASILNELNMTPDELDECYYYLGDCYASVGWHNRESISVYLVDWETEWGGIFQYKDPNDNDEIKSITPHQNLAITCQGELWHSVTQISPESPLQESLQIFLRTDK